MIRENSQTQKKTFTYEYDLGGNLVKVCEYPYTTGTLPTKPSATETGTFGQVWRDKLMKWNGVVMQYDSIGNMTKKEILHLPGHREESWSLSITGKDPILL